MILDGWRKVRFCRVASRPMDFTFIVPVRPRRRAPAGVVFTGAQFNINFVTARAFYPVLLTVCHPVSSAYITTPRSTSHGASDTLGTCSRKFGYMPRNYILLRLYLLFALLIVFTSTLYSDAISLILILRLT